MGNDPTMGYGVRGPLVAHILFASNPEWKGRIVNLLVYDEGSSRYIPGVPTFVTRTKYSTKEQLRRHPKVTTFLKAIRRKNRERGYPILCVYWDERNN